MNYIEIYYDARRNGYKVTRKQENRRWSFFIPGDEASGRTFQTLRALIAIRDSHSGNAVRQRIENPSNVAIGLWEQLQRRPNGAPYIAINGHCYTTGSISRYLPPRPAYMIWIGRRPSDIQPVGANYVRYVEAAGIGYCVNAAILNCCRLLFGLEYGCLCTYSTPLAHDLENLRIERTGIATIGTNHPRYQDVLWHLVNGVCLPGNSSWYTERRTTDQEIPDYDQRWHDAWDEYANESLGEPI